MSRNLVLASATGAITMSITNPLDALRIRWQLLPRGVDGFASTQASRPSSLLVFARQVVATEGLWSGLWSRGLVPNCAACACSVGVRLGFYPFIRDALLASSATTSTEKRPGAMLAAGLISGATGYGAAAPLFLAKTRLQAAGGAKGGALSELREVIRIYGLAGLWRGAHLLVARGAVLSASQTAAYDGTKTFCVSKNLLVDGPLLHGVASAVASVSLTTAVIPFDVVLTRYQTSPESGGIASCALGILKDEGPTGLLRGWSALLVRMGPSSFITFIVYEQLRRLAGLRYFS
eukprot:gnl/TRDRNA2_/TRDRNA2_94893_c0_seq2.p1 gnl/TRDRNA2_/TRDRNA2_94893_c0~~gnl/TRDRNA2_/TRDRNA2_94893_c0_seq2.p1  ORF type:complete len:292 (+),score=22.18 gnl/TRDRNA2_/TRDRNA2_94893_c0_seq2:30-905(+)